MPTEPVDVTPVPVDPSRGHKLFLAESRIVDGGVVVWSYRAFCRCNWSQQWATRERDVALRAYQAHKGQGDDDA